MALPAGAPRPDPIAYMTEVGASDSGRGVRERVLAALDLRPGQTVLDVGCGPGVNLPDLAAGVGSHGLVLGVDHDPAMAQEDRRRSLVNGHGAEGRVEVLRGDAHALPLADASADRARCDRILQHVRDPAAAITELRRVARPGAVLTLAEPDWDTLAIDAPDLAASAAFTRFTCDKVVRNARLGRQLARLADSAGWTVRSVEPLTLLFRDFTQADRILGLTRNAAKAVAAGYLSQDTAAAWLASLAQGPFLAAGTMFLVAAEVPA
jgi:ubiquinone/menaquinone biosynthesis C-methylase UbiE